MKLDASKGLSGPFLELVASKVDGKQDEVSQVIWKFRKQLNEILPQFEGFQMHDAHEFLVFFSETLQNESSKLMKSVHCQEFVDPILENFGYQLQETRECMRCHHETTVKKNDFFLRLDMPSQNSSTRFTMQSLLEKTLKGSSGIESRCEKCCQNGQDANIHRCEERFAQLPRVLVLYLPRTQPVLDEVTRDVKFCKNRLHVDVFRNLDLSCLAAAEVDKSRTSVSSDKVNERKRSRDASSSSLDENSPPKTPKRNSDGGGGRHVGGPFGNNLASNL